MIIGGGLCALAAVGYVQLFLSRPVGAGPAGPSVSLEPFAKTWTERQVHLLGIGDSVTAGLGARSPDHSYFNRLLANPNDEYPDMQGRALKHVLPKLTAENIAVSGSTSIQHMEFMHERLKPYAEDVFGVVVMTTGGNDLIHSYGRMPPKEGAMYGASLEQARPWIDAFEVRLNSMLDHLSQVFPGGHEVYLANIYDPTDGVGDAPSIFLPPWEDGLAIHAEYNRIIGRVAEQRENVFLVPLYQTFLGHGAHCRQFWRRTYDASDPHYWFYDNVEDPNDRGYDAIRRIFLNTILQNTALLPRK